MISVSRKSRAVQIGIHAGLNTYVYVLNNPLTRFDFAGIVDATEGGARVQYCQNTGRTRIYYGDGSFVEVGVGYSGYGKARDQPHRQEEVSLGPIPRGQWRIYEMQDTFTLKNTLPLEPMPGTDVFGRTLFRIHGDNSSGNKDASKGCIVLNKDERDAIERARAAGIDELWVEICT